MRLILIMHISFFLGQTCRHLCQKADIPSESKNVDAASAKVKDKAGESRSIDPGAGKIPAITYVDTLALCKRLERKGI
jgi:hypothetical protein